MTIDFEIVWHSLESVFTLLLLGLVGIVIAARTKWLTPDVIIFLPKIVIVVALPPYMLYNITTFMERGELGRLAVGVLVAFLSILFCFAASALMTRLLRVKQGRRGIFISSASLSNTIFIGLPVNLALFGEQAVPFVLIYYLGNTVLLWTLGNYVMAKDAEDAKIKLFSIRTLKQMISPPILGLLCGALMVALNLRLPDFVGQAARDIGGLTTPLAMILLGITMFSVPLRQLRIDREQAGILFGRLVISPLSIVLLAQIFHMPDMMRNVFIIQASLPCASSLVMLATLYKTDPQFCAVATSLTTLLSIISIPVFMVLVTHL